MDEAGAPSSVMQSWMELWNEWEIQAVVLVSFSLQVILFFFSGIRRYTISSVVKALLWLVYLFADVVATYALGHMSSSLSKRSAGEHQMMAFWAPFLLMHLGGQDTITAYSLEDNKLWRRHLLNMSLQVAATAYLLYKYIIAGGATFARTAMLVLAAGFVKYGERIWALKLASKGGSPYTRRPKPFLVRIAYAFFPSSFPPSPYPAPATATACFTNNKQFRTYAFIVKTAHVLRLAFVKPLIIDRTEASIRLNHDYTGATDALKAHVKECTWQDDESEDDASSKEKRRIGELYKAIEVQLALMYDMLYTKAEVIHKSRGHWIRAISLVCCFAALVVFTKSNRDGYSTPNIVITFILLGGACALEVASLFKAIGSTWTCDILRRYKQEWLANAILFARHHLLVVKDGSWSNSVGQFNFVSFCVHSRKGGHKATIDRLIGRSDKARCTKHAKLSPELKEFVWGLLQCDTSDMILIEDMARRFTSFDQSEQVDWSMSFEFQKSVLIWHIATSAFLNHPDVKSKLLDKDMAEAVNALSDYMMYLLVEHPDIVPIKPDARSLYRQTCERLNVFTDDDQTMDVDYQMIMKYNEMHLVERRKAYDDTPTTWGSYQDDYPGDDVLAKACTHVHTLLNMKLGLTYKMRIIGKVCMEMLLYAATNASGDFHARQLSNGGEFLTHILLLAKYSSPIVKKPKSSKVCFRFKKKSSKATDEAGEASAAGHIVLDVDDGCNEEITQVR